MPELSEYGNTIARPGSRHAALLAVCRGARPALRQTNRASRLGAGL